MNFLKKMRTRERIEILLKTIASTILAVVTIFLLEGMIFKIYMTRIEENKLFQLNASVHIAYCESVDDNNYKVYLHNTESGSWSTHISYFTKEQITDAGYASVIYRAPNAFDVSINTSHYVLMAIFVSAIIGFYGWRFCKLNQDYKKLENNLA